MNNKEKLIKQVKAMGQEVIDRAGDLVGDGDLLTDFDIWLRFDVNEIPCIEVTKQYISKNNIKVFQEVEHDG